MRLCRLVISSCLLLIAAGAFAAPPTTPAEHVLLEYYVSEEDGTNHADCGPITLPCRSLKQVEDLAKADLDGAFDANACDPSVDYTVRIHASGTFKACDESLLPPNLRWRRGFRNVSFELISSPRAGQGRATFDGSACTVRIGAEDVQQTTPFFAANGKGAGPNSPCTTSSACKPECNGFGPILVDGLIVKRYAKAIDILRKDDWEPVENVVIRGNNFFEIGHAAFRTLMDEYEDDECDLVANDWSYAACGEDWANEMCTAHPEWCDSVGLGSPTWADFLPGCIMFEGVDESTVTNNGFTSIKDVPGHANKIHAVYLHTSSDNLVSSNIFRNISGASVKAKNGSHRNFIKNNVFKDPTTSAAQFNPHAVFQDYDEHYTCNNAGCDTTPNFYNTIMHNDYLAGSTFDVTPATEALPGDDDWDEFRWYFNDTISCPMYKPGYDTVYGPGGVAEGVAAKLDYGDYYRVIVVDERAGNDYRAYRCLNGPFGPDKQSLLGRTDEVTGLPSGIFGDPRILD